jgi:hypothetical protein
MRPSGHRGDVGPHHLGRFDDPIECLLFDEPELQGGFLEREVAVCRMVRDLGGLSKPISGASGVANISERLTYSAIFLR